MYVTSTGTERLAAARLTVSRTSCFTDLGVPASNQTAWGVSVIADLGGAASSPCAVSSAICSFAPFCAVVRTADHPEPGLADAGAATNAPIISAATRPTMHRDKTGVLLWYGPSSNSSLGALP